MLTYICNICGNKVREPDAYLTTAKTSGIEDKYVFCPECWSKIMSQSCEMSAEISMSEAFERKGIPADTESNESMMESQSDGIAFPIYVGRRLSDEAKQYILTQYTDNAMPVKDIARILGVHQSTVYRELNTKSK